MARRFQKLLFVLLTLAIIGGAILVIYGEVMTRTFDLERPGVTVER